MERSSGEVASATNAGELPDDGVNLLRGHPAMISISFPDRESERKALAFLLGRFSGRVSKSGEHLVPEAALEALAQENIPFAVRGKATYEQQVAAIRGLASTPVE
jgi:hypothetical protein